MCLLLHIPISCNSSSTDFVIFPHINELWVLVRTLGDSLNEYTHLLSYMFLIFFLNINWNHHIKTIQMCAHSL